MAVDTSALQLKTKSMPARYTIKYNDMPARYNWGLILGYASAKKAGKARMNSMTTEEKTQFQSNAAKARWNKQKGNTNAIS